MGRQEAADLVSPLQRLAERHGVETAYLDWRGHPAQVAEDTLVAVLAALGVPAATPEEVARSLAAPAPQAPPPAPDTRARVPDRRAWGLMAQLYSVRSANSWGIGDLADLATLARWSGESLGAGFVLVNPLHAAEPAPPIAPSPYQPASRRFASPLYLSVPEVPEFAALPAETRAAALRAVKTPDPAEPALLDRDTAFGVKLRVLEEMHRLAAPEVRRAAYEAYRAREGAALTGFATWCALAEEHGPDWRRWPERLRDPHGAGVAAAADRLAGRVDFHAWLQWLLDQQLDAAQRAAKDAGMAIGVVHDLAVGVHPGGADAWLYQDLYAQGISVGAPPDEFNQRGQDWGQPPWRPDRLAAAGYGPYRGLLRSTLRHAGGLRLDHAMQVSRLWWVPGGASPADGAYVRYDRAAMLAIMAEEAAAAGAVIIGEDLGTVEPGFREDLNARDILGTSLLWFERDGDGRPKPPRDWRELSLATVGSHDMPPIRGFLHGDHIALRESLGLLTRPVAEEQAEHERQLGEWLALLRAEGLLRADDDAAVVAALHAFLARTPARLIGVALTDAVGERRTQNQPGTSDEYPNWRIPLCGPDGRPLLLEELPADPLVRAALGPLLTALGSVG